MVPWYHGTMTTDSDAPVERVQLGVRMERNLVKVLKGLAEFENLTLGQLLEKIVLHSFEPVPGEEGEQTWSALSKCSLAAVADLKRVYGLDYDMHAFRLSRAAEQELAEQ
jgi:predicted DNA-binding ribbon-helix-helix protein